MTYPEPRTVTPLLPALWRCCKAAFVRARNCPAQIAVLATISLTITLLYVDGDERSGPMKVLVMVLPSLVGQVAISLASLSDTRGAGSVAPGVTLARHTIESVMRHAVVVLLMVGVFAGLSYLAANQGAVADTAATSVPKKQAALASLQDVAANLWAISTSIMLLMLIIEGVFDTVASWLGYRSLLVSLYIEWFDPPRPEPRHHVEKLIAHNTAAFIGGAVAAGLPSTALLGIMDAVAMLTDQHRSEVLPLWLFVPLMSVVTVITAFAFYEFWREAIGLPPLAPRQTQRAALGAHATSAMTTTPS